MRISDWSSDVCSSDLHGDDFGNHVLRAADNDGVAHAHVQARDLVGVVQRRIGDGDAADEHGLEFCRRRGRAGAADVDDDRTEEHTSELQSLMRITYAVFCLKKTNKLEHKDSKIHTTY